MLKTSDRFLSADEASRLSEAGHVFLNMYSELPRCAAKPHLWRSIPKCHVFQYILLDAEADLNNPRFFHCFGDEDMVGAMLGVARACHSLTVVPSALNNYTARFLWRILCFGSHGEEGCV